MCALRSRIDLLLAIGFGLGLKRQQIQRCGKRARCWPKTVSAAGFRLLYRYEERITLSNAHRWQLNFPNFAPCPAATAAAHGCHHLPASHCAAFELLSRQPSHGLGTKLSRTTWADDCYWTISKVRIAPVRKPLLQIFRSCCPNSSDSHSMVAWAGVAHEGCIPWAQQTAWQGQRSVCLACSLSMGQSCGLKPAMHVAVPCPARRTASTAPRMVC